MSSVTVQLKEPHPGQAPILNSTARFRVAYCGRRFGKTDLGLTAILVGTEQNPGALRSPGGLFWWVGLSWKAASLKRAWRELKKAVRPLAELGLAEIRENDKELRLWNGAEIWLRTSENPDALSGEGLRGVVLDEFTFFQARVWQEHIRPCLADFCGWALFTGVPKGKNWGFQLWAHGSDPEFPTWESWQRPTADNPFIAADEIAEAKRELPSRFFEQEFMAAVLDDAGGVFRGVMDAATATRQQRAIDGHGYVMGVDWGKENDFTVLSVIDEYTNELVYLDRFNTIGWELQKKRLVWLCQQFRPEMVVAEINSMGSPLIEALAAPPYALPMQVFTTTNASKFEAINALSLAIETKELQILNEPVLLNELQSYEQERLPSGLMRYGAPDGFHDDTVMSLAFAWHGARGAGVGGAGFLKMARRELRQASEKKVAA
jgi:hypothetical protein